mgnify:CR=1 FL=1
MSIAAGRWHTRVHEHECDILGHVNNAWYLAYLQQATAGLWGARAPVLWRLRRLTLEYVSPAHEDDELAIHAWPAGIEGDGLCCGYQVQRCGEGQPLLRGLVLWEWLDRRSHAPWPQPTLEPTTPPEGCAPPRPLRVPPDALGAPSFHWRHTVRHHEVGPSGQVHPVDILHWVEEAKFVACIEVGWPLSRLLAENCMIVQVRHDCELLGPIGAGDQIEILSRVYDVGRVKGMWRQEVLCNGNLAVLEYATGAFLDRAGRPHPPHRPCSTT